MGADRFAVGRCELDHSGASSKRRDTVGPRASRHGRLLITGEAKLRQKLAQPAAGPGGPRSHRCYFFLIPAPTGKPVLRAMPRTVATSSPSWFVTGMS